MFVSFDLCIDLAHFCKLRTVLLKEIMMRRSAMHAQLWIDVGSFFHRDFFQKYAPKCKKLLSVQVAK